MIKTVDGRFHISKL